MELLRGQTLRARLDEVGTLDVGEAASIALAIVSAVGAAHAHGVIHRDLKPENILVTGDEPKVADFGLAHLAESSTTLTRSGSVLGTPMYMAPEQVEGGKEITARTDVHALGVLLYEILAGRLPHLATTIPEVYAKIAKEEPEPPRKLDPSIPCRRLVKAWRLWIPKNWDAEAERD